MQKRKPVNEQYEDLKLILYITEHELRRSLKSDETLVHKPIEISTIHNNIIMNCAGVELVQKSKRSGKYIVYVPVVVKCVK